MSSNINFQNFEPIFGQATPHFDSQAEAGAGAGAGAGAEPPSRFLFCTHAIDSARLQILATDFHSLTFSRIFTVDDLEDLRDDIGVGGSWSEFVDYLTASLSSENVMLVISGSPDVESSANARLTGLKSKGLPRISLALDRVTDLSARNAMSELSFALFEAFKNKQKNSVKEQEHSAYLMGILSSEREKNDNLQKQLDSLSFLSRRKALKPKTSTKISTGSDSLDNYEKTLVSEMQEPPESLSTKDPPVVKTSHRAAPVSRRARTRGVSLQDAGDDD